VPHICMACKQCRPFGLNHKLVSIVSGEARDAIVWRCGTADSGLPEGIYAGAILLYSVRNVEPINTTHRIVIAAPGQVSRLQRHF